MITEQGPSTKRDRNSSYAVDGNRTSSSWAQNTNETGIAWWSLDLGKESSIHKIVLNFNDPDPEDSSVEKRRPGWSLVLSNTSTNDMADGKLCYKDTSVVQADPVVMLSNCSSLARYIKLYNTRQGQNSWSRLPNLELSEVQVLSEKGCVEGTYGDLCEYQCGHCDSRSCDRVAGACFGPCITGFHGDGCNSSCSDNCKDPGCEKADGKCLGDCVVGFHGDFCNSSCSGNCKDHGCKKDDGTCLGDCDVGFHGDFCNLTCSNQCKDPGCEKDGKCVGDCNNGYTGKACDQRCPSNCAESYCLKTGGCFSCKENKLYTVYCNVSCPVNCKGGCDQSNGNCLDGCVGKFYGKKCELPCSNCKNGCLKDTGNCSVDGCVVGHYGSKCENECAEECVKGEGCEMLSGKCGRCEDTNYGDFCELDCNSNCVDGKCYRNGTCTEGCQDKRYHGNMCDQNCSIAITNCVQCEKLAGSVSCMKCSNAKHGEQCENSCPINCEKCDSQTKCTHCLPGFSGITCMDKCEVNNCKRCNTSGKCQTCEDGYFGESCEHTCADNCQVCVAKTENSSESICETCKKGYFSFSKNCIECIGKCMACSHITACTECEPGYYGTQCSKACPKNCLECTSDDTCTKCKDGWSGKNKCQCSHNCLREGDLDSWCVANGTCAKGCISGKFGPRCSVDCPKKERCLECDQYSGKCKTCVSGFYGGLNHCDKKCGNCLPDAAEEVICDIGNGECISPCVDGYFGNDCKQNCSESCYTHDMGSRKCEKTTGNCEKCKSGYFGNKCERECSKNCLDPNTNTNSCDKSTGECKACIAGFYGKQCSENCSLNCESSLGVNACDKDSGKCPRCKQKYYGDFCEKECGVHCESDCEKETGRCDACKSKHYGDYCDLTCPQNCGSEPFSNPGKIVCQRSTGECLHCQFGFYGESCTKHCSDTCGKSLLTGNKPQCSKADGTCLKCDAGFFGDFCEKGCSKNCGKEEGKNGSCDRHSGHCKLGCMPGWYNSTCEKTCNSTCKDHTCHWKTAECSLGCENEYEGIFCEIKKVEDATLTIVMVVLGLIVAIAVVFLIGFFLFRRYNRKAGIKAGSQINGTRMNKQNGRSEEIGLATNGKTTSFVRKQGSRHAGTDEVIEENESSPLLVANTNQSEYYNSNTQIPVSMFTEYLQNMKRESPDWYKQEFLKLPKGLLKSCDVATNIENRGKCRYKQLYPYDETRVKLEPEGDDQSDFINASYVTGYKKPMAFIAAQGPTDNTVNDFWRMIFQRDCGKIVMLTNLFEECKMKCVRYWPEADEPETYGIYEVTMITENELPNYTVRHLQATHGNTKEVKDFLHLHFTAWPDRGVPDNPSVMLQFRDKVMSEHSDLDGPILVHCSAGIGRTGTFVALDYLLKQAHVEPKIDVFRTVTDMRYQRTNFVQTDIQYDFVHNAISEALNTKESEVTEEQFSQYYYSMLETCQDSGITKLQDQFEMLHQMSPVLDESCFLVGQKEENILKNRHPDILPLDVGRAYLSTPVKGSNEYINAVFVPTCSNKTGFLITQMPLPHTVTDFWRLVYDQHVCNIVMMNNVDDDDETIGEYWPSDDSTYGPFRVELLSCDNNEDFSVMTIQLTHSSLSRQTTMKVKLFRYEGWSDSEMLPHTTTSLTSLISQVSRSSRDSKTEPIIVHCMDGAERSGLYCAVSSVLERLQMDKKINIPQTVLQLRARRPQLIKTFEQFDFCYRAVLDYLDSTQIYSNVL
ncbi:uncharacterized protein LOC123525102 isoform X2 [Mercenaria mercenaria]|nr:uncharacterized protein LOC123525102 isoform X2 [Mercenaria mercenaria]